MSTREEAWKLLCELHECQARSCLDKVDEYQRGIAFCLFYLRDTKGEIIAGDFAKELKVSTARIAHLLNRMENNHLITRTNSSEDARKSVIKITPEGKAYTDQLEEQAISSMQLLIEKVGRDDLKEFIRISRKFKAALSD